MDVFEAANSGVIAYRDNLAEYANIAGWFGGLGLDEKVGPD